MNFYKNVCTSEYDIIVLTETWLHEGVSSSELFDDRYIVYRRDRASSGFHYNKIGGGVLIAVNKKLDSRQHKNFESSGEDLWVSVDILNCNKKKDKLLICAIYLPPPVKTHILETFIHNSNQVLDNFNNKLILGDFNLSNISWNDNILDIQQINSIPRGLLLDFINMHEF